MRNPPEFSGFRPDFWRSPASDPESPEFLPSNRVRSLFPPPKWVRGHISAGDAEALRQLVHDLQPERVLEIGVAAGVSSAVLLTALDALPDAKRRLLYSVDAHHACYFDPSYPTGAVVADLYSEPRSAWVLHTPTDARGIGRELQAGSIDLIFIDADHRHPWPLLDVLHLAPLARPQAWVALHDIALARIMPGCQEHGAEWLFTAWPGEKAAGTGTAENLGAVRLPADLGTLVRMARKLLQLAPWEATLHAGDVDLPEPFAELQAILRRRFR